MVLGILDIRFTDAGAIDGRQIDVASISAGSLYLDAQDLPMVRPMTVIWEYVFWEMTTKVSGSERLSMTAADTEQ